MPWIKLGRFVLNLSDVLLVEDGPADGEGGVTVSLAYPKGAEGSRDVDLGGEEAKAFLDLFFKYRGVQSIRVGDGVEDSKAADGSPIDAVVHGEGIGVEESPILRSHSAGGQD